MGLSVGTSWVFEESADPTSTDAKYTAEGEQFDYPVCCFWMNTTSKDLFILGSNDGTTADWKKISYSA